MSYPNRTNGVAQYQRYPNSKNINSIEQGLEFQDFAMDTLRAAGFLIQVYSSRRYQLEKGESAQGWEFKLDNRCTDTQRLSIEVAERTGLAREWRPSGICATPASQFYVQGNSRLFFAFATRTLLWCKQQFRLPEEEKPRESPTVRAFYLGFGLARQIAFYVYVAAEDDVPF